MTVPDRALARVLSYPYDVPAEAYVFDGRDAHPLDPGFDIERATHGRTAVLAYGSNRSPAQLARKFADWPRPMSIPVLPARLHGYDVVYSAHFSRYGAVPATLHPAIGATVTVAIAWLSPDELARMDATEGLGVNYGRATLRGLHIDGNVMGTVESIALYHSLGGAMTVSGKPIAVGSIPCEGRSWRRLDQGGVQALVRDRLAPDADLHAFIRQNIVCSVTRAHRTARLAALALPFAPQSREHGEC